MPLVLLIIGALMSVVGLYAVVTGYRIVQVEEGWTTVISGTFLFIGGFLVIGLGLILRTLLQLKAVLTANPVSTLAQSPEPVSAKIPDAAPAIPAESPAAPAVAPPIAAEPESSELTVPEHPQSATFEEPRTATLEPPSVPTFEFPRPPIPRHTESAPPIEPWTAENDASGDYKLETPSTPEHDLAPPVPAKPDPLPAPASDDWLDRAFAEFDEDLPKTKTSAAPKLPKSPTLPERDPKPPREPAYAETLLEHASERVEVEPPPAPKAEPAPAAAAPNPVIGRYEADGTTYVMFADGSIEAQSSAGVYRFSSMAELKSFIEN